MWGRLFTGRLMAVFMLLIAGGLGIALSLNAQDQTPPAPKTENRFSPEGLPQAKMPVSETQACVESIPLIRSQHGQFLKHFRDETMYNGIRGQKHSLQGCVDCHVTPNAQGQTLSIHEDSQHFCRACHEYAAVMVDCFQCHTSLPAE
jgi:hypothetical protein